MSKERVIRDKLTILVNSCDAYEDLWVPFFTLLKKYWKPLDIDIILNTETKKFMFDGLNIRCVNSPKDLPYGQRMLNALAQIKTKYVLPIMDDFFIRQPVDAEKILEIISWMEEDPDIVYFNSDCTEVYADWEMSAYPGFRRIPPGNEYTLNMQVAIWRTEMLRFYWRPNVSPWEWEVYCNALTTKNKKHKFYCTVDWKYAICDYGYNGDGMGVFRGKWVLSDVKPLFEKEDIIVDYSLRGIYDPATAKVNIGSAVSREERYALISRCLGKREIIQYFLFGKYCNILSLLNKDVSEDYFSFLSERAKNKFLKKCGECYANS